MLVCTQVGVQIYQTTDMQTMDIIDMQALLFSKNEGQSSRQLSVPESHL
jgi:hypothetical protein